MSLKRLSFQFLLVVSFFVAATSYALTVQGGETQTHSMNTQKLQTTSDSIGRVHTKTVSATSESPTVRSRMMMSPWPVEIQQRGRHLCVESGRSQLLPVYTGSGSFYTAFRLQRGTNWLGGLPRGTYIINHKQITIG